MIRSVRAMLTLVVGLSLLAGPAAAQRTVSIQPPSTTAYAGDAFTLSVNVDDATGVAGFQFDLSYDGALMTFASPPRPGPLLSGLGWVVQANQINPNLLRVLGYSPTATPLAGGSGPLVALDFSAAALGTTPVALPSVLLGDTVGNPIPAIGVDGSVTVTCPGPQPAFSGTPTSGCAPLEVCFTDESTGSPTSWSWDFGDGGTSTEQNPCHTYNTPDSYTVGLTASNGCGSDAETKEDYISVNPPAPVANFTGTPTTGTAPLVVSFTDTSTNSPTSWAWSFGDGGTATTQNPSHTYENSGGVSLSRTVSLTVTNDGGSDTETKTDYVAVVPPAPVAEFSTSPTIGTAPLVVSFTDLSSNSPTSWAWSFGDGGTSTEQNPGHTYENGGGVSLSRTVSLTVVNEGGADTETKADYITVVPPAPVADFSASPASGPAPFAVSFSDLTTGSPTAWSWDFGDGSAAAEQHPSHEYADPGRYTVTLTASNAGGSDSETKTRHITASFSDVPPEHWAYGQIMSCVEAGIVYGYAWDKTYRPELVVDRAQMAVYISRALAGSDGAVPEGPPTATFPDVLTDHWAYRYIEYCYANGVVTGYWDGYHPAETVDRAQMAVYVARAMVAPEERPDLPSYTAPTTATFPDVPTDHWAYRYIEYCYANSVVTGYWDGYHPAETVDRAQMAVYVQRAFDLPM